MSEWFIPRQSSNSIDTCEIRVHLKMTVNRPRGTRDFLPEDTARRKYVENIMRNVACNWGYSEIITPTFEYLDLFTLKSGEGIVERTL